MHEPILVINAGSSSIKFSVFETGADRSLSPAAHGEVEGIGTALRLAVTDPQGRNLVERPVAGANCDYMPIPSSFFTLRNLKLSAVVPSRLRAAALPTGRSGRPEGIADDIG
jgi:hypothetical protein